MRINQHIKFIREQHNLSQEALAEQLAVSRQAVSKWEQGTALPSIENLMYISDLYDVSLDDLIKGDPVLEQKVIVDGAAKKWHWLSVVFSASLIIYLVFFGLNHRIWQIGLAISAAFMLGVELRVLLRRKITRRQIDAR